mmetsp:Transcript_120916/g.341977  ORF Transcript_120916/g.341977 Transcript_120916/m.341977 type:complete len:247 (+) Transcript_120916:52-792(+)|eukprot:CAMPEP_0117511212 /NCGR_PEP_ID=MMETSP0784-20121206/28390_1 /TAXON_ID=39447 /ORGANISM="" /LENGTH=246 /DNA_ID=CAMNT_0005306875 /DNA_START=52 /DNA_END=792 /DNA_ORIENTATION=+
MQRILGCVFVAVVGITRQVRADCPTGCPPKCPLPEEFQSEYVKDSFNLSSFWGVYYELAKHDNTQPCYDVFGKHLCVYCVRSVKTQNYDTKTYKDLFSIKVFEQTDAICDLEFNITERPGQFMGHWRSTSFWNPGLDNIRNTVVDVGHEANGTYSWTLEFQCRDDSHGINFAAVNFYHRNPLVDDSVFGEMKARLNASGLGWIMATSPGLQKIDQTPCVDGRASYPAVDAKPAWCGQNAAGQEFVV